MSALIVIPARLGATRLPNKPLRDLAGKPLIVRVLERVQALGVTADVVVATDAPEVVEAVRAAGGMAVLTRADHATGTDRIAEVLMRPEYLGHTTVVNVQGDEPFVSAEAVARATEMVATGKFSLATAACHDDSAILAQPSVVKVVVDDSGRALYFSRAPIPFLRDGTDSGVRDGLVLRHMGIYAYSRDALFRWVALPEAPLEQVERLEQLRPLAAGMAMGVGVTADRGSPGIDTEDDLRRANAAWRDLPRPVSSPVPAGTR